MYLSIYVLYIQKYRDQKCKRGRWKSSEGLLDFVAYVSLFCIFVDSVIQVFICSSSLAATVLEVQTQTLSTLHSLTLAMR